ncbi:hypothetical protein E3N88_36642 [Mikania micrantha]|uniref:Uncharacterized protein n=1 Tax=Mikania micrantha TaxID=192012 RepID=A0A5N6M4T7_9ASTR|nr:hypothetical protein E3N88_36642 [Mikania micrantha]
MAGSNKDMDRIKGPWSPEEDEMLQQLVEKHGPRNWSLIGKSIPGRSGKSVSGKRDTDIANADVSGNKFVTSAAFAGAYSRDAVAAGSDQ